MRFYLPGYITLDAKKERNITQKNREGKGGAAIDN